MERKAQSAGRPSLRPFSPPVGDSERQRPILHHQSKTARVAETLNRWRTEGQDQGLRDFVQAAPEILQDAVRAHSRRFPLLEIVENHNDEINAVLNKDLGRVKVRTQRKGDRQHVRTIAG
jgi:hypothetical protein